MTAELEIKVESYLTNCVAAVGGVCLKLAPLSFVGLPDRIVLLPGAWIAFVELKRPSGGVTSRAQKHWAKVLMDLGFRHRYINTAAGAADLVDEWRRGRA